MSGSQQPPPINRTVSLISAGRRRLVSSRQLVILGILGCLVVVVLIFTNPAHYGKATDDEGFVAPITASKIVPWTPPPPQASPIVCAPPLIVTPTGCAAPPVLSEPPKREPDLVKEKPSSSAEAPKQPAMVAFNLPPPREHTISGSGGGSGHVDANGSDGATHVDFKGVSLPGLKAGLMGDASLKLMRGLVRCILINDIVNGGPFQCMLEAPAKSPLGVTLMDRGTIITGQTDGQIAEGRDTITARSVVADTPTNPPCEVPLGGTMANDLGSAGIPADVDHHYLERFGPAVALSLTDSLFSLLQTSMSSGKNNSYLSFNTGGVSSLASDILRSQMNIKSTGSAHRGDAVTVWLDTPVDFSSCYVLRSQR